jgi:hypothetical protein
MRLMHDCAEHAPGIEAELLADLADEVGPEVAVAMDRQSPLPRLLMISTPAALSLRISCRPFMAIQYRTYLSWA